MDNVAIKALSEADWEVYKSLRLNSLHESPDSFGSTYNREAEFSNDKWKSRLKPSKNAILFVAEVNGTPSGLASGVIHDPGGKAAHIYQMWVAPEARRDRVGRTLLEHIIFWAEYLKLDSIALDVTTTNTAAVSLYESLGFLAEGEPEKLRPGSALCAQYMVLHLCK